MQVFPTTPSRSRPVHGEASGTPTQFSALDTLTASLDQSQRRPLRRDMSVMALVLTALTVALARIA